MTIVIEPSREHAVEKMFKAGMERLYRPGDLIDQYATEEAVRVWAELKVNELIDRGTIVIQPGEAS
jgi:hypothetical protein